MSKIIEIKKSLHEFLLDYIHVGYIKYIFQNTIANALEEHDSIDIDDDLEVVINIEIHKKQLKVNTKLIAINECIIGETKRKSLTLGKEYFIRKINTDSFYILDDDDVEHCFTIKKDEFGLSWKNYFKIETV